VTPEEAVARCEWWGRNEAETMALGSTRDPVIGAYFDGEEFRFEQWSNPGGSLGWAIRVPRFITGEDIGRTENPLYALIEQEIERRSS
jgi:hypothetical protein